MRVCFNSIILPQNIFIHSNANLLHFGAREKDKNLKQKRSSFFKGRENKTPPKDKLDKWSSTFSRWIPIKGCKKETKAGGTL